MQLINSLSRRRSTKLLLEISVLIALVACANYSPPLERGAVLAADRAYLYGSFIKSSIPNFGLVLEDVARTRKYTVPFERSAGTQMFRVEPGTYEITQFIGVNFANEVVARKSLLGSKISQQFTVSPGEAVYLGEVTGVYEIGAGSLVWRIESIHDSLDAASRELVAKFPDARALKLSRAPYLP
jgi:hypothetical protein